MTINPDRPTELYIPRSEKPQGFRFIASIMLAALKEYDCTTKRQGEQHTPKGDYIQILPNDPDSCIYACHIKAICANAPKDQIIDAEYTTEGVTLSYDNTSFNLKWQSAPDGSFTAHLATGDTPDKTPAPDAWLQRACQRPSRDHHQIDNYIHAWGNMATDGYRVHIDPRLEPSSPPFPRDISFIIDPARKYSNIATIAVKPLVKAIKQAISIQKTTLRLRFNGCLEVIAKSEESGNFMVPLHNSYTYDGPDAIVGINPRFLLDALSGFDNEVLICLGSNPPEMPVYLTDGTREAVIMPMHLN